MKHLEHTDESRRRITIGYCYFFQTCTKDWVGRVIDIPGPYTVVMEEASWVAESGRLHIFLRDGKADGMEIEPVGHLGCQWVNWTEWDHKLFKDAV